MKLENDQGGAAAGTGSTVPGQPVFVLGQGRSGSTLVIRILNAAPGIRISGENEKALDHLRGFYGAFEQSRRRMIDPFYSIAWAPPCELEELAEHCRRFVGAIWNPGGQYRVWGFKEIRYGASDYIALEDDLEFIKLLFPHAKFILNTRKTEDAVRSAWWAAKPKESAGKLDNSRANLEAYATAHPENTFLLPYETLKRGSQTVKDLFKFIGVEYSPDYEKPMDVVLR